MVSQKSAEGKVGHAVGEDIEALQRPKGGETDRPRRERGPKSRTAPRKGNKGKGKKVARLRSGKRKKNKHEQEVPALPTEGTTNVATAAAQATETLMATRDTESL